MKKLIDRLKRYETLLTAAMPPDFKDWHQNSREEWPEIAAEVIKNLREREHEAWKHVDRISDEIERIKKNHGCARHQGMTQFCQEAVDSHKEADKLMAALHEIASAAGLPDPKQACRVVLEVVRAALGEAGKEPETCVWKKDCPGAVYASAGCRAGYARVKDGVPEKCPRCGKRVEVRK